MEAEFQNGSHYIRVALSFRKARKHLEGFICLLGNL